MTPTKQTQRPDMLLLFAGLLALPALVLCLILPAYGAEPGEAAEISLGGKLYDNHWLVSGKPPPEDANPVFPPEVKTTPANTWRCVSCHGWDYSGTDGHLGSLSTSKTFRSLRSSAGKDPQQVVELMRAPGHRPNLRGLSEGQVETLARFVSVGQLDITAMVEARKSKENHLAGKDIFEGACISCHQADGKAYFQGEDGDRSSLGWVANNRPEQALHKIINGVPSADMLSLRFLPPNRLADLLSYLQTLDEGGE